MPVGTTGKPKVNPASGTTGVSSVSGSNLPSDTLSSYNVWQLAELAYAAGFGTQSVVAAAVAMAESSGNPIIIVQDSNGTHDVGLWQINSVHGYSDSDMQIPSKNVVAAKAVYDSQGWEGWTTYKTGAYKKYLLNTQQIAKLIEKGTLNEEQGVGLANAAANTEPSSVQSAISTITHPFGGVISTVGGLIGEVTSGSFWIMVLKILAGVVLIGVGLYMLVKNG